MSSPRSGLAEEVARAVGPGWVEHDRVLAVADEREATEQRDASRAVARQHARGQRAEVVGVAPRLAVGRRNVEIVGGEAALAAAAAQPRLPGNRIASASGLPHFTLVHDCVGASDLPPSSIGVLRLVVVDGVRAGAEREGCDDERT